MQKIQERSPRAATRSLASTIRELDAKVLPPWEPHAATAGGDRGVTPNNIYKAALSRETDLSATQILIKDATTSLALVDHALTYRSEDAGDCDLYLQSIHDVVSAARRKLDAAEVLAAMERNEREERAGWNHPSTLPDLPFADGEPVKNCPEVALWVRSAQEPEDPGYTVCIHEWAEEVKRGSRLKVVGWIQLPSRAVGVQS